MYLLPVQIAVKEKFTRKIAGCVCLSEASVENLSPNKRKMCLKALGMPICQIQSCVATNSDTCDILNTVILL